MNYNKEEKIITLSRNTGVTISISFLVLVIGGIVSISNQWTNTLNHVSQNKLQIAEMKVDISTLEADNVAAKTQLSAIEAQLQSIHTAILDVKSRLQ